MEGMSPTLQQELRQTRPFETLQAEAFVSIARTAAVLGHTVEQALKPYDITLTQFNVLRILRGAGEAGLCRNAIRDRLVAQVPDVTRLLDRMEQMALLVRERDLEDRRYVTTRITPRGLELLSKLDEVMREQLRSLLRHLPDEDLRRLIELLAQARAGG